jgi:hypothetical protein
MVYTNVLTYAVYRYFICFRKMNQYHTIEIRLLVEKGPI